MQCGNGRRSLVLCSLAVLLGKFRDEPSELAYGEYRLQALGVLQHVDAKLLFDPERERHQAKAVDPEVEMHILAVEQGLVMHPALHDFPDQPVEPTGKLDPSLKT